MNIYGSLPEIVDKVAPLAGGRSHALASDAKPSEAKRHAGDVEAARSTALSALKNDRFGTMLAQIFDPGTSGALVTMQPDATSTDFKSVLSSYAENGE
ncbi:hypothetical protein [Mesorhizobium sp. A623]